MIWLYDVDAYELLRRVDYDAYLNLLEDFPLKDAVYELLEAMNGWATTSELCLLLKNARPVFDTNDHWIKKNRIAFIILNLLGGRLLRQPFEDGEPSENFKETLTEIIDILIARSDAIPLGYAWLQRLLMSPGKSRRQVAVRDDGDIAKALLLVATNLAAHLGPHSSPMEWIAAEEFVWRNWRIYALLAIEVCRQPVDKSAIANLIAHALSGDLVSSVGIDRLANNPRCIERQVIANAIAQIPDPAGWFTNLWEHLFWQRDRARWLRHTDQTLPSVGQVIVLWVVCGLELLDTASDEARALWLGLYDAVRESILTEAFRQHNDAWSLALRFLAGLWLKTFPDDPPAGTPGSLEDLVTAWMRIGVYFAQLVEVLDRYGVQPERLRRIGISGDMLRTIVEDSNLRERFLLHEQEIAAIIVVAEKLDGSSSPVPAD